jgi:hypothetical protein
VKRIFIVTMVVISLNSNISATNVYQSVCSRISGIGQAIEGVNNIPVIGKLTNLLPMAALAASLKECPMQTMIVLSAVGAYVLSCNEAVREMIDQYEIMNSLPWIKRNNVSEYQQIDESLFVFDGDEYENEATEDDLLGTDLLGDDEDSEKKPRNRKVQQAFL